MILNSEEKFGKHIPIKSLDLKYIWCQRERITCQPSSFFNLFGGQDQCLPWSFYHNIMCRLWNNFIPVSYQCATLDFFGFFWFCVHMMRMLNLTHHQSLYYNYSIFGMMIPLKWLFNTGFCQNCNLKYFHFFSKLCLSIYYFGKHQGSL